MFIYTLLTACGLMMTGCSGDKYSYYEGGATPNTEITATPTTLSVPVEGDTYAVAVGTTGVEWNAYSNERWIQVEAQNTASQSGTAYVAVQENPYADDREGSVVVMSGTTRSRISVVQRGDPTKAYPAPDGYTLVWNDEFNAGSVLNADDWTHEVKNSGWVNSELQNYVNHTTPGGANVTEVKDGRLRITCLKEDGTVYSGRVYAKVSQGWTYGYIEASIKLPKGKGTWPAFWMMPVNFTGWPDSGEIDIMEEVGGHANYVSSSLHANAHVHTNNTQVTHEMFCEGAEDDFHTYAIEWTADKITTYVDGKIQLDYENRGLGHDDWPYDAPFYIILNLAWGGTWGGTYGIDESALPCTMEVDYVRVFQK